MLKSVSETVTTVLKRRDILALIIFLLVDALLSFFILKSLWSWGSTFIIYFPFVAYHTTIFTVTTMVQVLVDLFYTFNLLIMILFYPTAILVFAYFRYPDSGIHDLFTWDFSQAGAAQTSPSPPSIPLKPPPTWEEMLSKFNVIRLCVGNGIYRITKEALQKRSSLFSEILNNKSHHKVDEQGQITIPRNNDYFRDIVQFLSGTNPGFVDVKTATLLDCKRVYGIWMDAEFYKLTELTKICEKYLKNYSEYQACKRICYDRTEKQIVENNENLIARFVFGRNNNQLSQWAPSYLYGAAILIHKFNDFKGKYNGVICLLDLHEVSSSSYVEFKYGGKSSWSQCLAIYERQQVISNADYEIERHISHMLALDRYDNNLSKEKPEWNRANGQYIKIENKLAITC